MIKPTNYKIDPGIFKEACNQLPKGQMKTTINQPTGDFFYDLWILKDEYKNTVWQTIYDSLPAVKGEARIIILDPGQCYQSHADIDDRYHLNILGDESFLIDLVRERMHRLAADGIWYDMDAGWHHTAANFGRTCRIQLVVRKLLTRQKLTDPIRVKLSPVTPHIDSRFIFDHTISPWLNLTNKSKRLSNFKFDGQTVSMDIDQQSFDTLKEIVPDGFKLELPV
jgi:hypothetical protein